MKPQIFWTKYILQLYKTYSNNSLEGLENGLAVDIKFMIIFLPEVQ